MPSTSVAVTHEKDAVNRRVLRLLLNDWRHFGNVTSDGRLFQFLLQWQGMLDRQSKTAVS